MNAVTNTRYPHGEPDDKYPVIVEYTEVHVVWVEAPTPADAVEYLRDEPYELTSSATSVDGYHEVRQPGRYEEGLTEVRCDAHVLAHQAHLYNVKREAEKAACAAAGHPNSELRPYAKETWCPVCYWLPTVEAVPA